MFAFCSFCCLSKLNCLRLSSSSSSLICFFLLSSFVCSYFVISASSFVEISDKFSLSCAFLPMSTLFYFLSFVWVCIGCLRMGLTMRVMETRLLLLLLALFVFEVACTHRSAPRVHLAFKGESKHYSLPVYVYSNTQLLSFSFAYTHMPVHTHTHTHVHT